MFDRQHHVIMHHVQVIKSLSRLSPCHLARFTKEFKKMAEDIPEGVRNPKLLTAALDLALACVKCYECPGGGRFGQCVGQ